jgi:hypothetical protein
MKWDARKRRYVDERGHVIPPREVRRRIEDYIESEQEDVASRAAKVIEGAAMGAFFTWMADKIRVWHSTAGALAYGGEAQMDKERWARIENKIQTELEFLAAFEREIQGQEITEVLSSRAQMYTESTYATYENNVTAREFDSGVTLGRRVCEEDSVSCEECVSAASTFFEPLGDIPEIGSLSCLSNCRCTIEFAEPPLEATLFIDQTQGEELPA